MNIIEKFEELRLPAELLMAIQAEGIHQPTPIQKIALPLALSNRDLLAISFTGTGKTLVFLIRALLLSYQE